MWCIEGRSKEEAEKWFEELYLPLEGDEVSPEEEMKQLEGLL